MLYDFEKVDQLHLPTQKKTTDHDLKKLSLFLAVASNLNIKKVKMVSMYVQ